MPTVSSRNQIESQNCSVCGSPLVEALQYCSTCCADAGAPNVRACCSSNNSDALNQRFESAKSQATENGCLREFEELCGILKNESCVVVAMSGRIARNLLEDPKSLYANYENMVGARMRVPASSEDDANRFSIGGRLFGSYANSIVYGALSLAEHGLSTYGDVHCKLRSVAIERRTSFLESNSYRFSHEYGDDARNKMLDGFSACWDDRQKLVLSKLVGNLSAGQELSNWERIICNSDGQNRENDEFVEAHIFGGFNWNAIESIVGSPNVKRSRGEQLDFDLAIEAFTSLRS